MGFSKNNRGNLLGLFLSATTILVADSDPLYADRSEFPDFESIHQIPGAQSPPSKHGNWLGWGGNIYNNHWAGSDAMLDTNNVGTLQPVCQKEYETGVSAAPLVEEGVAYYPTWNGLLVALDYPNCQTLWELNITSLILQKKGNSSAIVATGAALGSRTTPVSDGDVLYIGTLAHALVVAVDKLTGRVIDTLSISDQPLSMLTQSPTFYNGRLLIGLSTSESGIPALDPNHTFSHHASMRAVALQDQRLTLLWTTPMIPRGANFSGASIWGSQPSIDPIRQQVFIGTGQLFSLPPEIEECQDANKNLAANTQHLVNESCMPRNVYQISVLALDIATGKINWVRTLGPLDAWNQACKPDVGGGEDVPDLAGRCPRNAGNDTDFGMAPTFVLGSGNTPDGKDVVIAGQKNGNLYAFSAATGMIMWGKNVVPGGTEGGLSWGVAVDDAAVYYTGLNSNRVSFTLLNGHVAENSVWGALALKNGDTLWETVAPRNTYTVVAPAVVNDVVLTGLSSGNWSDGKAVGPGSFVALDKRTGKILLERQLGATFRGNFAIVHDYVMFGTGYRRQVARENGAFNVWKLNTTENGGNDTTRADLKHKVRRSGLERQKIELKKRMVELRRQEIEIDRLREL
jgi:outer membrane protein assembly factor BamB